MRVALAALIFAASPALAEPADCEALRAGRPFQITLPGTAPNGQALTLVEQYGQGADGAMRRRYIAGDRQFGERAAILYAFTTLLDADGVEARFEYPGLDLSSDPYGGDRPFTFIARLHLLGRVSNREHRAEPAGTDIMTVSGCTFAVRLWNIEESARDPADTEGAVHYAYAYAPELRIALTRSGADAGGRRPWRFSAQEITTTFTPFE